MEEEEQRSNSVIKKMEVGVNQRPAGLDFSWIAEARHLFPMMAADPGSRGVFPPILDLIVLSCDSY